MLPESGHHCWVQQSVHCHAFKMEAPALGLMSRPFGDAGPLSMQSSTDILQSHTHAAMNLNAELICLRAIEF